MDLNPILYQDIVDGVVLATEPAVAPANEPSCSICGRDFGSAGWGMDANVDFFSQLPFAVSKIYDEPIVEPVRTSCGHIFCLFCLGVWFNNRPTCTCPMCRYPLHIVLNSEPEDVDDEVPDVIAETSEISQRWGVSRVVAMELYNIRLIHRETQIRTLMLTIDEMPFRWNLEALLRDLPIAMTAVARRFHYQALNPPVSVREDPYGDEQLHPAMDMFWGWPRENDLDYFQTIDGPLAVHEHAIEFYGLLYGRIQAMEAEMGGRRLANWEGSALTMLYKFVHEYMPNADGGVGAARWRAYMWCVIKVLFVWQAYCERAHTLINRPDLFG
ncbi:hypothetical protein GMOD_00005715 [Pyrenophora seminiperda CCB06]|uniref:RING-type domain-containing protein n=1 Tax=Pyrenophora seminiperda CCB06 TaxID=1302712 RepID=A0A3M7M9J2_9PLEO|nr:hypothetical protein GMOD_00005715 [Pyrenophora seminiperda CCB06]